MISQPHNEPHIKTSNLTILFSRKLQQVSPPSPLTPCMELACSVKSTKCITLNSYKLNIIHNYYHYQPQATEVIIMLLYCQSKIIIFYVLLNTISYIVHFLVHVSVHFWSRVQVLYCTHEPCLPKLSPQHSGSWLLLAKIQMATPIFVPLALSPASLRT